MSKIQTLKEKIAAKKREREQARVKQAALKFAKLRYIAEASPEKIEGDLQILAETCHAQAEAFANLLQNLDLVHAKAGSSAKERVATAKRYASGLRRIAEETPGKLQEALSEAWHSLDEQAGILETLAEDLDIHLDMTPVEEAFGNEGQEEIAEAVTEGESIDKKVEDEAEFGDKEAGTDAFVTDRDSSGSPQAPKRMDVPEIKIKSASMTQKDFKRIGDDIRNMNVDDSVRAVITEGFADTLQEVDKSFSRQLFVEYVMRQIPSSTEGGKLPHIHPSL
jgi:hypothetical protein